MKYTFNDGLSIETDEIEAIGAVSKIKSPKGKPLWAFRIFTKAGNSYIIESLIKEAAMNERRNVATKWEI
jgi:hypothetical protein